MEESGRGSFSMVHATRPTRHGAAEDGRALHDDGSRISFCDDWCGGGADCASRFGSAEHGPCHHTRAMVHGGHDGQKSWGIAWVGCKIRCIAQRRSAKL
eukprot:6740380-Prymnesium_polylepis.1